MEFMLGRAVREAITLVSYPGGRYGISTPTYLQFATAINMRGSHQIPLLPRTGADLESFSNCVLSYLGRRVGSPTVRGYEYSVAALDGIEDLVVDPDLLAESKRQQLADATRYRKVSGVSPFTVRTLTPGAYEARLGAYVCNPFPDCLGVRLIAPGYQDISALVFEKEEVLATTFRFTALRVMHSGRGDIPLNAANATLVVNGGDFEPGSRVVVHRGDDIGVRTVGPSFVILQALESILTTSRHLYPRYQAAHDMLIRAEPETACHMITEHAKAMTGTHDLTAALHKVAKQCPEGLIALEGLAMLADMGLNVPRPSRQFEHDPRALAQAILLDSD